MKHIIISAALALSMVASVATPVLLPLSAYAKKGKPSKPDKPDNTDKPKPKPSGNITVPVGPCTVKVSC